MEAFYIGLGAFLSVFIFFIGYATVGVVSVKKHLKGIDRGLEGLDYRLSDSDRTIHEVLNREIESLRRELYDTDQDIRSKMDSRLDKLENKLSTNK